MKRSIGRIVHYKLSEGDAALIQSKHQDRSSSNQVSTGDVYPAMIVRVWGTDDRASVNLQVFLDGDCSYWATSRGEGVGAGCWAWPERI